MLTNKPPTPQAYARLLADLEICHKQNAELLAALEALVSYANDGLMLFPDNEEWETVRKLIAKAKGG